MQTARLVEVPIQDGGTFIVEVEAPTIVSKRVMRGSAPAEAIARARWTLESALQSGRSAAESILKELAPLNNDTRIVPQHGGHSPKKDIDQLFKQVAPSDTGGNQPDTQLWKKPSLIAPATAPSSGSTPVDLKIGGSTVKGSSAPDGVVYLSRELPAMASVN